MRKLAFLQIAVFTLVFLGCSGPKDPTFEKFENIKVQSISKNKVTLNADMILNNPNPFSCHFKNLVLEVYSDSDVKLTEIEQTYNTEMLADSNFSIPVIINFSPDKLFEEKQGLLNTIVNVLNNKEVNLKYKGYCNVEAMEISIKVPIDFEETMILKK